MSGRRDNQSAPQHDDIAIVGMGCRFPGAPDLPSFWRTMRDQKIWAAPIPKSRWNHDLFYSETGAREHNKTYVNRLALIDRVEHFDPDHFGITPRRAKVMDPQQRLFLDVVRMALEDAGYAHRPFPRATTGVFVGATVSDFMDILITRMKATLLAGGEFGHALAPTEDAWKALTKDLAPLQAYSLVGTLMNMVAANVNQVFDLGGPAFTMDAACSSALVALHEAVVHLRAGLCDAAVVGGVYLILAPDNVVAFSRIGAVSQANACRPFDQRADGFVIGEGLGAVILRRLPDALRAGDHIYAVVRGVGMNNDGKAEGPMTPRKEGQVSVLERAYSDAGVSPLTVDFIEAHGTATPVGDATEIAALFEHRGRAGERPCALSSVKANFGHSMSAAGIAGLIRAALSVDRRILTAHAGYGVARDDLMLPERGFMVPTATATWDAPGTHPRRAGVNSFGFGGTNVHVVLEEAPAPSARPRVQVAMSAPGRADRLAAASAMAPQPELVVLSAPNEALLRAYAADLRRVVEDHADLDLERIAYTLSLRRTDALRAAFVVATRDELLAGFAAIAEGDDAAPAVPVFRSQGPVKDHEETVAFLFPGQGAQAPGLCADLYQRYPVFRRGLDELTGKLTDGARPLLSFLYPRNGTPDSHQAAMAELTRTEICQPIMAAIGLAIARLCRAVGVKPAVVTGHSLGEFAAAAAAGVFAEEDAVALVAERGRLIADLPLADRGSMAAVAADRAQVGKHLAGLADVVIANVNHPGQTVISGTGPAVARALARLEQAGVKFRKLSVSHAFHSPLMAGLREPFEARLENTAVRPSVVPVVSAVAPGPYPGDAAAVRELCAEHATRSVDFAGALRVLTEHGARVFLQMGGGSALSTMARLTLSAVVPDGVYLTAAGDAPDHGATFLRALAALFARGETLDFAPLFEDRQPGPVMLPASQLETRGLWPVKTGEAHAPLGFDNPETGDGAPVVARSAAVSSGNNDGRAPGGDVSSLSALFDRQMALLDAQIGIIEQQNRLLSDAGVQIPEANRQAIGQLRERGVNSPAGSRPATVAPSAVAAPVGLPAPAAPPTGPASASEVERTIIEAAARITAQPPERLSATTRLAGDLGFDSLMVVELTSALGERFPGLALPRSLFAGDTTIGELAVAVVPLLPSAQPAGTTDAPVAAPTPFGAHVVQLVQRSLPDAAGTAVGRVTILALDANAELPRALCRALADRQIAAEAVTAIAADQAPSILIDLRGVTAGVSIAKVTVAHAADFRTPLERALATVRALGERGQIPGRLLLVHTGGLTVGLEGFAKGLAREWDDAVVRSIELPSGMPAAAMARILCAEIGAGDAALEVRYRGAGPTRFVPVTQPLPGMDAPLSLSAAPVVVISGGARGLGAILARALARSHQARLAILGRAPSGPATEALLEQLRTLGGEAIYLACDVRDPDAVAAAVTRARAVLGPIELCLHTAGVVEDAPLGRKTDDSFARVFDTKVGGALALWNALSPDPLRAFVLLGSYAGRFGNAHQIDYAAANNTLARLCEPLSAARPDVRVTAFALPPWTGGGMLEGLPEAARKVLAARLRFLTDAEGVPFVIGALSGGPSAEIVIAPGAPPDERKVVFERQIAPAGGAASRTEGAASIGYLEDHVIAGRRVLPLAGAVDLWVEAAQTMFGGPVGNPGLTLTDVTVLGGVLLPGPTGAVKVTGRGASEGPFVVEVSGLASAATGRAARVGLRARLHRMRDVPPPITSNGHTATSGHGAPAAISLEDFFAQHTFHGPGLRALAAIDELTPTGARARVTALPVTGGSPLVAALDGVLQLFAYHATCHQGRGGLPLSADAIHLHRLPEPGESLSCVARVSPAADQLAGDADLFDAAGQPVLRLRGLRAELRDLGAARAASPVPAPGASNGAPAIPTDRYRPEEWPEVKALEQRLDLAKVMGIANPYFRSHEGINAATAQVKGRTLINYSSYNYLGLSGHPEVIAAVKDAVERFGSSVSASRIASGQRPLHHELETELARFLGCEDSIVMVGGHATNVSVIGHLFGPEDLIVHDSLAHDSILGGARLSGARRRPFAHNDPDALHRILRDTRAGVRRLLIAVEGVYSMDGDIAPLPRIIELKKEFGAMLLVDEAHSIGVLGKGGHGAGEYHNVVPSDVDMWMGTLSKSFASCGGYIGGSERLIRYLRYSVPGFVYSVGISPANAAAALCAVRIIEQQPELPQLLHERSRLCLRLFRERGINTGMSQDSAVIPCIVGNSYASLQLAQALEARGINVQPILFPAVEENQARLRFFVSVTHTEEQLITTADILAEELTRIAPSALHKLGDAEGEGRADGKTGDRAIRPAVGSAERAS